MQISALFHSAHLYRAVFSNLIMINLTMNHVHVIVPTQEATRRDVTTSDR